MQELTRSVVRLAAFMLLRMTGGRGVRVLLAIVRALTAIACCLSGAAFAAGSPKQGRSRARSTSAVAASCISGAPAAGARR